MCQEVRRLSGKIKCAASCFGGKRTGTSGRGSAGTIKVFVTGSCLLRCDCRLMNEIRDTAEQGSVFCTVTFHSYTSLKFFGKQRTVDYSASRDIVGVSKSHCLVYRKEMEWRYNYRNQDIYHSLIKIHVSPFLT